MVAKLSVIFSLPPPIFFGDEFFNNLKVLTERLPVWRNLGWIPYVAVLSTVLTLLFCSMGGYAFALFDVKYKNALFGLVMGKMLLPSFMNMIPTCWRQTRGSIRRSPGWSRPSRWCARTAGSAGGSAAPRRAWLNGR